MTAAPDHYPYGADGAGMPTTAETGGNAQVEQQPSLADGIKEGNSLYRLIARVTDLGGMTGLGPRY